MTLQQLKYVITVAETGTITEAAKKRRIQISLAIEFSLLFLLCLPCLFRLRLPVDVFPVVFLPVPAVFFSVIVFFLYDAEPSCFTDLPAAFFACATNIPPITYHYPL